MTYEVFTWLKPDLTADQVKKEIKEVEEFLKDAATVVAENLGKRKLAYKIKGYEDGIQINLRLECKTGKLPELPVFLNRKDSVLRYLLTKEE
jgi:small subunit ribosomal protein S6